MTVLNDLAIGDHFIFNNEEYEKIEPIKKSCCSNYTARKVSDGGNTVIKPNTEVEVISQLL
jgi:hypothetical protein